jgi:hypothetical protein
MSIASIQSVALTPFLQVSKALPLLAKNIYSADLDTLVDAAWALSYLSDGSNQHIQAVVEAGVCRRLVDLLTHPSPQVQTPALRCIGNIVTGDDLQTQVVIASGALPALLPIFRSHREGLRKEACWTVSNVLAGTTKQIQAIIDAGLWPELVVCLTSAEPRTRREACWAVSNATSGASPDQIAYFVDQNTLGPLCAMLTMMDNRIIKVTLEAIENILKNGDLIRIAMGPGAQNPYAAIVEEVGGMVAIHNLQSHDNNEIYTISYRIMETYFGDEDEDVPVADDSGGFKVCIRSYINKRTFHLCTCLIVFLSSPRYPWHFVRSVPERRCSSSAFQFWMKHVGRVLQPRRGKGYIQCAMGRGGAWICARSIKCYYDPFKNFVSSCVLIVKHSRLVHYVAVLNESSHEAGLKVRTDASRSITDKDPLSEWPAYMSLCRPSARTNLLV